MKQMLFAVLLTVTLTTALIAQRGRGGPGPGNGPPDPASALKQALGLSDAQVDAIKALIQASQTRTETIRTDIRQKRQALDSLLNSAAPNALDVGNAAIALHAAEARAEAERTALISQIKQQLTGEQQQKLDALLASGRGFPLGAFGGGPGPRGRGNR
jgi:Spy/CpxP family protein refolding chaperone